MSAAAATVATTALQGTAFWRVAGMNFLQYQHVAASSVRSALKPEFQVVAAKREVVHFRARPWDKGVKGDATIVSNPLQRIGGA